LRSSILFGIVGGMATKQTAPAKRNEALIEYLAALPTKAAKEDFAKRCRTSLPFLKQVAHGHKPAANRSRSTSTEKRAAS
jgi:hypothetical protein